MKKVALGVRITLLRALNSMAYIEIYNAIARFPCDSTAFLYC